MDELFRDPSRKAAAFDWDKQRVSAGGIFSWRSTARLKLYERLPWKPLRQRALRQAQEWLLEHMERSEAGGDLSGDDELDFRAVALGHSPDDPLTAREIDRIGAL